MSPKRTPPRDYLKDEMAWRGWDDRYIANHTTLTLTRTRSFLKGDIKLDEELATELGHLIGTSPSYWLNLQNLFEKGDL